MDATMTLTDPRTTVGKGSLIGSLGMDSGRARIHLEGALAGANDGELYAERAEGEDLLFDDGQLKSADYSAAEGFGLRVVAGEAVGYSFATRYGRTVRGACREGRRDKHARATPALPRKHPSRLTSGYIRTLIQTTIRTLLPG